MGANRINKVNLMNAKQLYNQQKHQFHLKGQNHGRPPADLPTKFTDFERQIVYGSMLGDGGTYYNKPNTDSNERYQEGHSIIQRDYIDWKIDNCFSRWMSKTSELQYHKAPSNVAGANPSVTFYTRHCAIFTIVGRKWHEKNPDSSWMRDSRGYRIKKLPEDLINIMSSEKNRGLGLAVWYMDDGSYHLVTKGKSFYLRLYSMSFTEKENYILVDELLWKKFGVEGRVYAGANNKFFIQMPCHYSQVFLEIVRPWIKQVPSMIHKLGVRIG